MWIDNELPGHAYPRIRACASGAVQRVLETDLGVLAAQEKIYTIPVMKVGITPILVTGDADRNKVQIMPGGNSATFEIKLPANWNDLMAKLGC